LQFIDARPEIGVELLQLVHTLLNFLDIQTFIVARGRFFSIGVTRVRQRIKGVGTDPPGTNKQFTDGDFQSASNLLHPQATGQRNMALFEAGDFGLAGATANAVRQLLLRQP
jgi:hypothetical protein